METQQTIANRYRPARPVMPHNSIVIRDVPENKQKLGWKYNIQTFEINCSGLSVIRTLLLWMPGRCCQFWASNSPVLPNEIVIIIIIMIITEHYYYIVKCNICIK